MGERLRAFANKERMERWRRCANVELHCRGSAGWRNNSRRARSSASHSRRIRRILLRALRPIDENADGAEDLPAAARVSALHEHRTLRRLRRMPVGRAARGAWLVSGARAPHGGRTWGERATHGGRTFAAVDALGHVSSLSPQHCTGGRLGQAVGRPSPLPSCCRGRIRGLGRHRAACLFASDGGEPGR